MPHPLPPRRAPTSPTCRPSSWARWPSGRRWPGAACGATTWTTWSTARWSTTPRRPTSPGRSGLAVLPKTVPAVTVSRACSSANQAIADARRAHRARPGRRGHRRRRRVPVARPHHRVATSSRRRWSRRRRPRRWGRASRPFKKLRPRDLVPVTPAIAEPTTGETMGEAAERMAKENGISREDQDAWALRSHQLRRRRASPTGASRRRSRRSTSRRATRRW